ncbi:hypothetical protein QYE76_048020 [Lolium multiflorum]|uniref:Retrotransposon gag domain-containing protein n=1 Tax=Lolium multiflorum TaxID=4521 RepID=A0AAD8TSU9_LOLMU|nr:hypothetical protein QYE76_048020 [Lolium multiflorum]
MEMVVVSMEEPSGALPRPGGVPNRDSCPPDLGFAMAAARKVSRTVAFPDCASYDEDIPTSLPPPSLPTEDEPAVKLKSNEVRIGPLQELVRSYLNNRYEEEASIARGGEEQLDVKMDVKLDKELDMKISHGRAREEREACARGEDEVQAGPAPAQSSTLTMSDEILKSRDAHNARDAPRGDRPRGWAPLGRNGRGQDEEDGLGKPKFSIPKFEGGADVEEYLTWELKIEKLWSLHPHYTEDRKIKLASSEFDGYALRWWDRFVHAREEDGEQPIITWRAMKAAMTERFVPTNYLRCIFDKLTLLRQGVKTVDEYYMEMEMLMQHGRDTSPTYR